MLLNNKKTFSLIQYLADAIVLSFSWLLAYLIRFELLTGAQSGLEWEFAKITPFLVAISLYSFHKNGLYRSLRFANRYKEIFSVLRGNFFAVVGLVILLYFVSDERISRLTIVIYLGVL